MKGGFLQQLIEKDYELILSSLRNVQHTLDRMKKRYINIPDAFYICIQELSSCEINILLNNGGVDYEFNNEK